MISRATQSRDREYFFIDGGCLRAIVRTICQDLFGDPNTYRPNIRYVAKGQYDKIFYYDAVPGQNHGEPLAAYEARVQSDHERFKAIQALDRVHVSLGRIVGPNHRQKGVDVQLAVDMMTHAFRGNITKATLFAGDADFVPLVKALVNEGLHVTLWHPPQANEDLRGVADTTRLFDFKTDHDCLTADGQSPAFQIAESGNTSGTPEKDEGLTNIVTVGDFKFAGRWRNNTLKIWQGGPNMGWSFAALTAPAANLATVIRAFDQIYPWNIAAAGVEWIET